MADTYEVLHDTALSVDAASGVLENDSDWDSDPLAVTLISDVSQGQLALVGDDSFEYTLSAAFVGEDSFTYTVSDGVADSDPVTVMLHVANSSPVANEDTFHVKRNGTLAVAAGGVLGNDYDLDGDPVNITLQTAVAHGSLTLNSDGSFDYTPSAGYVGIDSFTYTINDGVVDSDLPTVDIEVANTAPEGGDDSYSAVHDSELTVAPGGLFENDFDLDNDTLTANLVDDVSHGTLSLAGDGSFTYLPTAGFVGFDRFSYRLTDGVDQSDPAIVTLEVTNTRPVTFDQYHRVLHGTTLTVDAASGLIDKAVDAEGDTLSVSLVADVNHGELTIQPDNSFTYTPNTGFVGAWSQTVAWQMLALESVISKQTDLD